MLSLGASIGYFQGDVRKLIDDIGALRPTMFVGVPRVFERIYDGVQGQVRGSSVVEEGRGRGGEGRGGEEKGREGKGRGGEGRGGEGDGTQLLCVRVCVLGMAGARG